MKFLLRVILVFGMVFGLTSLVSTNSFASPECPADSFNAFTFCIGATIDGGGGGGGGGSGMRYM